MPVWTGAATGLLLALAFWSDIRTMRIPNALTGGFFVAGLLAHAAAEGEPDSANRRSGRPPASSARAALFAAGHRSRRRQAVRGDRSLDGSGRRA